MMALNLQPGDEIICPAFTYVATAEVIGLLGLKPVMVDVNKDTFDIQLEGLEKYLTPIQKQLFLFIYMAKVLIWNKFLNLQKNTTFCYRR